MCKQVTNDNSFYLRSVRKNKNYRKDNLSLDQNFRKPNITYINNIT